MTQTHKTIIFCLFYIFGLISFFTNLTFIFAVSIFLILGFCLIKNIFSARFSIILFCIFCIGIFNANFHLKDEDKLTNIAPTETEIEGVITSIPVKNKENSIRFDFYVDKIKFENQTLNNINDTTRVSIETPKDNFDKVEIGKNYVIKGKLRRPLESKNPSQFNYRKYLRHFGIFTTFYSDENNIKFLSDSKDIKWKFLNKLNKTRIKIINYHKQFLKSPNIEILGGIVFGDDAINPPDFIKTTFINSGLFHILAASGMNVALIFGIWFFLSRRIRLNYRISIIIGMLLVVVYAMMTGLGSPIVRATLMIEAILFGKLLDRQADTIALLAFVGFLMLLVNPNQLNEIGFQLSFTVTFGILLLAPVFNEKFKGKISNFIASSIFIPVIAQLWVFPIQMFYFNTFCTYSIFANILILPFVTIISFLGFISSILCLITPIATFICKISDFILNPVITLMIKMASLFANAPHSLLLAPKPSFLQIILYYSLLLLINFIIIKKYFNKKILTILLILICSLFITFIKLPDKSTDITFFDVGNADSFLIKTPENKYILIDTGKSPYKKGYTSAQGIVCKYMKDRNIRKIDLLILTHFDSDHAGGADYLINNFKIGKIIMPISDKSNIAENIYKCSKQKQIEILSLTKDLTIKNNFSILDLMISQSENENENSIITIYTHKNFKTLFMGDAGVEAYNKIQNRLPNRINILKIGHHGAKYTINQKMLDKLKPETAVISTGMNTFGHPNSSVIKLLEDNKIYFYRTDFAGAVNVNYDGENIKYKTFVKMDNR